MFDADPMDENIEKDWYHAVKSYHELNTKSPMLFLSSEIAKEFGLDMDDIREFRRAVQSFDAKWQAAVKVYMQGKFNTPRKFLSSGKFLKLGFSPSREHAEVLRFALKFYEEEGKYRQNANSDEITALGRYGGNVRPMYATIKARTPNTVVGFDGIAMKNADGVPRLLDLHDDSSAESVSRLSTDSSVISSTYKRSRKAGQRTYIQVLLTELGSERKNRNPVDAMTFFAFAVIPLVIFAQLRAIAEILFPFDFLWTKQEAIEESDDIEDEWERLRASTLMLGEDENQ